jgi:hypothetical protein
VAGAALLVLGAGVVTVVVGAAVPPTVPLGALGTAAVRVDDGGLLVRVEAELRTRKAVVLRSATTPGGGMVVLLDPVPDRRPGAPDAVRQRVVALLDPGCGETAAADEPVLEVTVQALDDGQRSVLRREIAPRALRAAERAACRPVRATVTPLAGAAAQVGGESGVGVELEVGVQVELVDNGVTTGLVGLTGRGLRVEVASSPLPELLRARSGSGAPAVVATTARVVVTECSVEVLAPRGLELLVERSGEQLAVPVTTGPEVVALLDELVRRTCRRERG